MQISVGFVYHVFICKDIKKEIYIYNTVITTNLSDHDAVFLVL